LGRQMYAGFFNPQDLPGNILRLFFCLLDMPLQILFPTFEPFVSLGRANVRWLSLLSTFLRTFF